MEVRRPASVDGDVAEARQLLAPHDLGSLVQPVERVLAQVPVERKEPRSAGGLVLQDDRRAVVELVGVVVERVHPPRHRREHTGAGLEEDVYTEVDCALFWSLTPCAHERLARVAQAGFVVAADPHRGAGPFHLAEEAGAPFVGVGKPVGVLYFEAADA